MNFKTFNLLASMSAFAIGAIYLFSDGASMNANVIGASGSDASFTSIIGIVMIISAIGLFIVSMHSTDNHPLDLERLVRRNNKFHEEIRSERDEEAPEMKKSP